MAKNDLSLQLLNAELAASEVIDKYGISDPVHIQLLDILFDNNSIVVEDTIGRAAARLTRIGNRATVRVPPDEHQNRKRFSIAHEFGHFKLNHVAGTIEKVCSNKDMESWCRPNIETEANFFASELLMPQMLVRKMCDVAEVNLEPIREIARSFRTSLTASAIRFVRFCPESCAVVCSENGKISWSYRSPDWWAYIPTAQQLDNRTVAYDFFNGVRLPDEPIEVDANAWINAKGTEEIVEHSIGSKSYGFVLSILWIRP